MQRVIFLFNQLKYGMLNKNKRFLVYTRYFNADQPDLQTNLKTDFSVEFH